MTWTLTSRSRPFREPEKPHLQDRATPRPFETDSAPARLAKPETGGTTVEPVTMKDNKVIILDVEGLDS